MRSKLSAVAAAAFATLMAAAPSRAGDGVALNEVWSRLADVNGEAGSVETSQFSPDSRFIVSGTKFDFSVILWRVSDGAEQWRITLPQEVEKAVWTRDGTHIATISEDRVLRLIRASDGRIVKEVLHDEGIDSVEVSHNGRWLATGSENGERPDGTRFGTVRIFSLPDLREVARFDHGETINEMDFSPDDSRLVTAGDNHEARIWRTSDWSLERTFEGSDQPDDGFVTTRFHPDGDLVAVSGFGGYIYVWRLSDGDRVRRFNKTGRKIESLQWSPDGQYLATGGHDDAINFFRTADLIDEAIGDDNVPIVLRAPTTDHLEFLQFNSTGALLTTAQQDGTIHLFTFMGGDPTLNARRHAEVKEAQAAMMAEREAAQAPR